MLQNKNLNVLRRGSRTVACNDNEDPSSTNVPLPSRRWKTRVLLPGGILAAAFGLLAFAARDAFTAAVPVQVLPAIVKSGIQTVGTAVVQAPGWVEPDPYPITISALTDGVVQEVLKLEGEPVKKGDVVARLVREDAQLAVDGAAAELQEREAELEMAKVIQEEAQRNWDNPIELQRRVAMAEAALAEKRADLAKWPAELEAAQARLAELKADYDLQQGLQPNQIGPKIKLIQAQRQYEAQQAVVKGLEQQRVAIESQVKSAEAEATAAKRAIELRIPEARALAESKARTKQADAAIKRAQVQKQEAELRLKRMDVHSPVDGVVMARLVQPGMALMLNAAAGGSAEVMRLHDPQKLQVRVDVPLADAAHVGVEQEAEVVVNILPDRTFRGRVTRIVHEADIQKNTLQVKVAIHEPSAEIKPEMLARVKFLPAPSSQPSAQGSIFVPKDLVRDSGGRAQVWLVDQTRNVAERRDVTVGGVQIDGWVQIQDGIRAGDWLIADPPADLQPGASVRITGETTSHSKEGH